MPWSSLVIAIIIRLISHGVCEMTGRAALRSLGAGGIHSAPSPLGGIGEDPLGGCSRCARGFSPGPVLQMSHP